MIQYITHSNIDKLKWDNTVSESLHPEIYALSWYLDIVSPNWSALIYNDFEAIMPIPIKSKFGITYVVQPPFCQKLGIFSKQIITSEVQKLFNSSLSKFISIRYCSNTNIWENKKHSTERANYILPLYNEYSIIANTYNSNTKRNIKKAITSEIQILEITKETFLDFYTQTFSFEVPKSYSLVMKPLLENGEKNQCIEILGAFEKNELCGATVFFKTLQTSYYLFTCGNEQSKQNGAIFMIIDSYIKRNAGLQIILDFEGSSIPGIAQFYKGFGAELRPFYLYTKHKLKLIQKLMK